MDDWKIVELFWQRDERAVGETSAKYGGLCLGIATRLLADSRDASECLNETLYQAWSRIPPQRPEKLGPWLGRVTRNISVSLWRKNHRQKRYSGLEQALGELEDCIPSPENLEQKVESAELGEAISWWLGSLAKEERILFVRRYWYGIPLRELAEERGIPQKQLAQKMYRLRQKLKTFLEKEDGHYENCGQLRSV